MFSPSSKLVAEMAGDPSVTDKGEKSVYCPRFFAEERYLVVLGEHA